MARRALGPATLQVVQAVAAALDGTDTALVTACSGGPDSLALVVGAQHAASRRGLPHTVVVVDHGLQPGSAAVAARAAATVTGLGLGLGVADVRQVQVRVDPHDGSGPEAAARRSRYAALDAESAAVAGGPATVLLGHTRDDQAETVLLGLARGSGSRSLAGMAPRTGPYLRPLLGLDRAVTVATCAELGLEPWSDPHNDDPAYARVRVRRRVLPVLEDELGPGVAAALARTAALARDDADLLDALAADADPGTDTLGCAELAALPAALRRRVLRRWLARHGSEDLQLDHVLAVEALVQDWHGQRAVHVPRGTVARHQGRLLWQAVGRG
ncbi:tRNA lysidine(34) synthetase TilS [uncultured Friedmanniella sp.]|uniref:tRNA lysidine(34) synthetase TilS n=1 Tax=uncultured Friedmanniella sp. TaxID=335381 RepID=UPI0035CB3096